MEKLDCFWKIVHDISTQSRQNVHVWHILLIKIRFTWHYNFASIFFLCFFLWVNCYGIWNGWCGRCFYGDRYFNFILLSALYLLLWFSDRLKQHICHLYFFFLASSLLNSKELHWFMTTYSHDLWVCEAQSCQDWDLSLKCCGLYTSWKKVHSLFTSVIKAPNIFFSKCCLLYQMLGFDFRCPF